ncbi:methyltransferase domain-containing protein [Sphaerospermopsis sp. LEGE 00249]|uniref:glycosyltransferase n=1 Tax=Sphaerospermopsis sp. LEGE 00249 TaxID=1380707 RepID=UPI002104108F|nr:methyltransferase domain-containing protein [Sphaerospermopsis sp. LEGE 00249]
MKLLIDGAVFSQVQDEKAIDFWQQLIPRLILRLRGTEIYYLNRNSDLDFPDISTLHNLYAPSVDFSLSALEDRRLACLCRDLQIDVFISTYNTSAGSGIKTLFIDIEKGLDFDYSDDFPIISSKQRSLRYTSCYLAIYQEKTISLQNYVNLPSENIQFIYTNSEHEIDWITVANFVAKSTIKLTQYQLTKELAHIQLAEEEATQAEALQLRKQVYGGETYQNYQLSASYQIEQKIKHNLAKIAGLQSSVNYEYDDNWQLTTPVGFLIFNRPETTARVFEAIRQAKPPKLLVVADGPRAEKLGEAEKCAATRAIINQIDWECEVLTNYSNVNLGCRKRVSSGLDWIFEQVEEAIILEDDCLPHPTFFRYCQELLEKYRDDQRVMMISGDNFQFGRKRTEDSYYFSRYGHVWGWASWRRAWTKYDDSMAIWPRLKNNGWLSKVLGNEQAVSYWTQIFQAVYDGFNTWDYIWLFTLWANNGLTILPHVNLVSNIGFGSGTHTTMSNSPLANMSVEAMTFPLQHPLVINRNSEADNFTEQVQFSGTISQSSTVESVQKCKVCNSDSHYFAKAKILQKYDVNYFQCSNCGFVQTEEPYWLDEAYSEAIAISDVGLVYRNNMMANITGKLLFNYFDHQAKFLDYGGGYGLFVRLMRDQGFDFYWFDKFCKNIFARGFELETTDKENLELITAFELFEHLTHPLQELEYIINLCPNLLFSTELLPEDNPTPDQWWYYTPHEGQHISIYTRKSLEVLASKYNLQLYTDGKSLHLLTKNRNLPNNLFEEIAKNNLQLPNKESLLSHDFNQVVNKILQKNQVDTDRELVNIPEAQSPIIIIDGVFFQLYKTGIARVWQSILEQWKNTEFAHHILVLDRANTAPKINGIRYRTIAPYDYNNTEADKQMLQEICNEEAAELFISTYYTTPIETPSVFMAYDMIPEVLGGDLNKPMWREKHHAIQHASAYISISENTAKDLHKCFPDIPLESITVAHCGVDPLFSPASETEINTFTHKYGIHKPYFILSNLQGYKNAILFFQALNQLANKESFDIVSTGAGNQLPSEWRQYTAGCTFHGLELTDEELRLAYAGAVALVYPSKYEGFGMPVIEAMACGCPVITTRNASLPEVAGQAAIYINDNDVMGLADALCEVQKPSIRNILIDAGFAQAKKFSWTKMAETMSNALIDATLLSVTLRDINLIIFPDWTQSEDELGLELQQVIQTLANHPKNEKITLIIYTGDFAIEDAEMFLSSVAMNLLMADLDISDTIHISLIETLSVQKWQSLLPKVDAKLILNLEDKITREDGNIRQLPSCKIDNLDDDINNDIVNRLNLNLRDINLIIFPDWTQPEDELGLELQQVIQTLANHPENEKINLIIYTGDFAIEDAEIFLSSVAMNLLMEDLDISDTIDISLVGTLVDMQWQSLLTRIYGRVILENENKATVTQAPVNQLNSYQLDSLINQI